MLTEWLAPVLADGTLAKARLMVSGLEAGVSVLSMQSRAAGVSVETGRMCGSSSSGPDRESRPRRLNDLRASALDCSCGAGWGDTAAGTGLVPLS